MSKLLSVGVAAIACAAYFGAAGPAAADDYCRRGVTDFMLSCGFNTLAQCQAMSSGRGGDCLRNPSLGDAASAYAYAPVTHKHRQK
jgi:Protein of unknown function (DUF3551)